MTNTIPGPKILLTIHGVEFLISPEDHTLVGQYSWGLDPKLNVRTSIKGKTVLLTTLLIPEVPKGYVRDHINRNKLDNQRSNLRVITARENNLNHSGHSHTAPGNIPGVQFHKASNKWRAYAYYFKRQIHLGLFATRDEAILARAKHLSSIGAL